MTDQSKDSKALPPSQGKRRSRKNAGRGDSGGGIKIEPNLTYPIILNATLYQPPQDGIYTVSSIILTFAQLVIAGVLAWFTYSLSKSTSTYSNEVCRQTDIMIENKQLQEQQIDFNQRNMNQLEKQLNRDIDVLKYNRLRDEMDKLVAPLYFATLTADLPKQHWGFFMLLNPIHRWEKKEFQDAFVFWDGIKKNIHLSQSEKLSEYLMKHIQYNRDFYADGLTEGSKKNFEMNIRVLVLEIKDRRYPKLLEQIGEMELSLGINIKEK
jgi:hypothetical protein